MRIAICLYGHFRCFELCWPSLRDNLLVPNQIQDAFAISWEDSMGYFQHPESAELPLEHPGFDTNSEAPTQDYVNRILDILRPIDYGLHDYRLLDLQFTRMVDELRPWHHPSRHHRPKGTLGQVWGRCASIALKQWHEEKTRSRYDLVVVTRWDIRYERPIDLSKMDRSTMTMDGMYGPTVISDAWACGPTDLVDRWATQFACIDDLVVNGTMNLGPHEWLKAHFDHQQIPWQNDPSVGIHIQR